MDTKQCKRCLKVKNLSDFPKEPRMRDGHRSTCKQCRSDQKMKKYKSDPEYREKEKARVLQYTRSHPEWNKKRAKEWAKENHAHVLERAKRYWHEKVDKAAYNLRRNEQRRERYKTDRAFQEKRKEEGHHSSKMYKARMKNVKGSYSTKEWNALCEKYGHRCLCCGKKKPLTVDHVVPISKNGTNYISNIQPLCMECNVRKSSKTIDYRY